MAAITFDTMRFVRTLEKAGLPAAQAEAISTAFKEASGEAEIATKRDIEKLEFKLDKESTMIKWMLGVLIAGVLSIVMKAFF